MLKTAMIPYRSVSLSGIWPYATVALTDCFPHKSQLFPVVEDESFLDEYSLRKITFLTPSCLKLLIPTHMYD